MYNKCLRLIRVSNQLDGWVKDKCESVENLFRFIVLSEADFLFIFCIT